MSGKNTQNMVHDGRWRYSSRHFKRIFGSSVMAKTMDNIIQEDSAEDPALQSVRRYNSEGDLNGMMKV